MDGQKESLSYNWNVAKKTQGHSSQAVEEAELVSNTSIESFMALWLVEGSLRAHEKLWG